MQENESVGIGVYCEEVKESVQVVDEVELDWVNPCEHASVQRAGATQGDTSCLNVLLYFHPQSFRHKKSQSFRHQNFKNFRHQNYQSFRQQAIKVDATFDCLSTLKPTAG